ncbi:MAG: endonuclease MutS2, partial [Firmicutes bacterium]|nr:endonuclease MutS2 [Bacillota bacterium]
MADVITAREIESLEFNEIRKSLAALTVTSMAKQGAERLLPSADCFVVERRLQETGEGRLLWSRGLFSLSPVEDISPLVVRAEKGGALQGSDLAAVGAFLKGVQRCRRFFQDGGKAEMFPLMAGLALTMNGCAALSREMNRCIDSDGEVLDSASPELGTLRRRERRLQENIREKMDSYLRNPAQRRLLQEAIITIRGNRFVLPVKQEYSRQIRGIVHDQSASGATLFIEPLPVVQLQNELTGLQFEISREIERILRLLSSRVAENGAALHS